MLAWGEQDIGMCQTWIVGARKKLSDCLVVFSFIAVHLSGVDAALLSVYCISNGRNMPCLTNGKQHK